MCRFSSNVDIRKSSVNLLNKRMYYLPWQKFKIAIFKKKWTNGNNS